MIPADGKSATTRDFTSVTPYREVSIPDADRIPADRSAWKARAPAPTRRAFLKGVLGAAATLGAYTLHVLPFARPAWADGFDMVNGCNGLQRDSRYGPCVGCCCSTICAGGHCCVCFGSSLWHRADNNYMLRPNDCAGEFERPTTYDGWYWTEPGCGCSGGSPNKKFKCHDGKYNPGSGYIATICMSGRCV